MTEKGRGVGKIVRIYVFNRNHRGTLTSCGVECLLHPQGVQVTESAYDHISVSSVPYVVSFIVTY